MRRPLFVGALAGAAMFVLTQLVLRLFVPLEAVEGVPVAGDPLVASGQPWRIVLMAVLVGPLLETAIAQWLPIELLRRVPRLPQPVLLLASPVLFSAAHMLNGSGALHGATTFTFGLLLAGLYLAFRPHGARRAFAAAWAAHTMNNGLAVAAMLAGFS